MADGEKWHLDRRVPLSIILTIILQTVGMIVWGTRLDSRVGVLETTQLEQNNRLLSLEKNNELLAVINERQQNVLKLLDANGKRLEELLNRH